MMLDQFQPIYKLACTLPVVLMMLGQFQPVTVVIRIVLLVVVIIFTGYRYKIFIFKS